MSSIAEVSPGRNCDGSSHNMSEAYVRDVKFIRIHDDGSEKLSELATAFFDMENTETDMITTTFVTNERLEPVKKYEERDIRIITSPLSTDPVRIVGEVEARWRGFNALREGQALFLGRKFYQCRLLIIEVEGEALFDACFCSKTIQKLGLGEKPSLSSLI